MIDLTPLEVRKKKGDFRRTMRGYEPQAVDDFLDLVADRLEQIVREHFALNERVAAIDTQIADYRERERALTEALVSAQEMREEMRRQMEREADLKRREAEAEAEVLRSTAAQQREREEENIRRLRARQSLFVQSYRAFLERELAELAVIAETIDAAKMIDNAEEATPPPLRAARTEPPASAPIPMPLPVAEPVIEIETARAPEPAPPAALQRQPEPVADVAEEPLAQAEVEEDFAQAPDFVLEAEAEAEAQLAPDDSLAGADFDALLDEVPFAPLEEEPPLPLPAGDVVADAGKEPLPDIAEIELIDESEDDEGESDGWVSTLLEGKGD